MPSWAVLSTQLSPASLYPLARKEYTAADTDIQIKRKKLKKNPWKALKIPENPCPKRRRSYGVDEQNTENVMTKMTMKTKQKLIIEW